MKKTIDKGDPGRITKSMCEDDDRYELIKALADFRSEFPRHLVRLTEGDNVVYELYKRNVSGRE